MFCSNCGAKANEDDRFCCNCGMNLNDTTQQSANVNQSFNQNTQTNYTPNYQNNINTLRWNPLAIIGFIISIIGINTIAAFSYTLMGIYNTPFIFPVTSIVLCIIGLVQISKNKDTYRGKGLAISGIIISVIVIISTIIIFIALAIDRYNEYEHKYYYNDNENGISYYYTDYKPDDYTQSAYTIKI